MEPKLRFAATLREDKLQLLKVLEARGLGESAPANRLRRELWPDPEGKSEPAPLNAFMYVNTPNRPKLPPHAALSPHPRE